MLATAVIWPFKFAWRVDQHGATAAFCAVASPAASLAASQGAAGAGGGAGGAAAGARLLIAAAPEDGEGANAAGTDAAAIVVELT